MYSPISDAIVVRKGNRYMLRRIMSYFWVTNASEPKKKQGLFRYQNTYATPRRLLCNTIIGNNPIRSPDTDSAEIPSKLTATS